MKTDIQLLIFDLGNVIFDIDSNKTFNYWSELTGLKPEFLKEMFFSGNDYISYELGETSEERFRQSFSKKINFNISKDDFIYGFNLMITGVSDGMEELLGFLDNKYFLAVLSNTNRTHEKYIMQNYTSIMTYFDKLFFSHRIKCRKPEKKIFQIVLEYFNVIPENVMFFDDVEENINSGIEFGLNSFLISKNQSFQIKEILKKYCLI
ncbi:MAG: HAD family hydrolase [Brevinematia bacterium]